MAKNFTIMGIDPGYGLVGYGLVQKQNDQLLYLTHGVIKTKPNSDFTARLLKIHLELKKIINQYQPQILAIESLFFHNNAKTALQVGEARGVIILTASQANLSVYNITPLQVKQALVGHGRAEKKQIQKMVQLVFKLPKLPQPDDAADALAVAYCGAQSLTTWQLNEKL